MASYLGARGASMNHYPLNRTLVFQHKSSRGYLSITGQLITELYYSVIDVAGNFELDFDFEASNLQIFKPDYLIRSNLNQINDWIFDFLKNNNRTVDEIILAAENVRTELWSYWDFQITVYEEDTTDFYTGEQSEHLGPKSYQDWEIFSDIFFPTEVFEDDWMSSHDWQTNCTWTYPEIYGILTLWAIDEAIVYVNKNNLYKASVWLARAVEYRFYTDKWYNFSAANNIASIGGKAKAEKYQPLKDLAKELCNKRAMWQSRRNAAITIAPQIIEESKRIGRPLSEHQAIFTINNWLKQMGLPANISL